MKRFVAIFVLGVLTLGLTGCSGSDSTPKDAEKKAPEAPGIPKDGV